MTSLRKKMEADMRLVGHGPKTRTMYLGSARRFAEYHGKSPAEMDTEHVRDYLLHIRDLGRAPATVRSYWAALRFLYEVTLDRPNVMKGVPRPRVPRRADRALVCSFGGDGRVEVWLGRQQGKAMLVMLRG